jgi:hypothetical protein
MCVPAYSLCIHTIATGRPPPVSPNDAAQFVMHFPSYSYHTAPLQIARYIADDPFSHKDYTTYATIACFYRQWEDIMFCSNVLLNLCQPSHRCSPVLVLLRFGGGSTECSSRTKVRLSKVLMGNSPDCAHRLGYSEWRCIWQKALRGAGSKLKEMRIDSGNRSASAAQRGRWER